MADADGVRGARGAELLTRIVAEIDARRDELRPLLAEYERLLEAAEALEHGSGPAAPSEAPSTPAAAPPAKARGARSARAARKATGAARRGSAAGTIARAGSGASKRAAGAGAGGGKAAARSAAQQAIVAALEHGSHTVAELSVVTAMTGSNIRVSLRRLLAAGAVTRAKRDGKAAYALARSLRS